jgi:hypothetical protein
MNLGQIRLYDLFRRELLLPDAKAADFVDAVGEVSKWKSDGTMELFAPQSDMDTVKSDIHLMKSDINSIKGDLHSLYLKIERYKGETTKAIYWAGLAQFVAIPGGLIAILKFIR